MGLTWVGREDTHLVILVVNESQLELVLGGVDAEDTRSTLAVEAVDVVALDTGDVDGQVQGADDAVVTTQAQHMDY